MKLFDSIPTEAVVKADYAKTGVVAEIWLKPSVLLKATQALYADGYYIVDLLALDVTDGILIEYHFDKMTRPGRIKLKVMAENGVVPSIANIFQGANWHEREVRDFHAVDFTGHPNLWPLLLPTDMEPGVLLKEDKNKKAIRELFGLGEAESCSSAVEALFAEPEASDAGAGE
ncbi:MAG: NADH-quinone oxidoreductase subunit C [Proteobacteria bacterium]|nr:NADH-quinone oxidoreductase subunit C [Pseudomonadota bacterium]MBU1611773.1 NADH-quinone oxidoreductase subunit C [Pseudomonadota bacterium]